jgi:hypothetical protein
MEMAGRAGTVSAVVVVVVEGTPRSRFLHSIRVGRSVIQSVSSAVSQQPATSVTRATSVKIFVAENSYLQSLVRHKVDARLELR